ncbi:MAG: thymidine phosphorylase, partial [Opitutaceae bacterium]|nr:thymidine phosphorylase [Opitutaceae bacterium]
MNKRTIPSRRFIKPSYTYLIEKKRDGGEFTQEEIRYIIDSILDGEMPQYQLAALSMAIYFQGMSAQETAVLTEEMMFSGEVIDLSHIAKPKIDKYSTGGIGDKTSLVLVPLAVASGIVFPMMCGEEQDYVISSLSKLGAIPGFKSDLSIDEFISQLETVSGAFAKQSDELAPADAKMFALRRSTGTIPSIPLITGSVLSKKLAEGAEGLVIDVKWGNGSFIKDLEVAKQLARSMARVGRSLKRRCVALVTDMNQPLGDTVGTSLELKEAIALLKGEGTEDMQELILKLGMEIVRLAGVAGSTLSAKQTVERHIKDGTALEKLK